MLAPSVVLAQSNANQFGLDCKVISSSATGIYTDGTPTEKQEIGRITNIQFDLDKKLYCTDECEMGWSLLSYDDKTINVTGKNLIGLIDGEDVYYEIWTVDRKTLVSKISGENFDATGKKPIGTFNFSEQCTKAPFKGIPEE